MSEVRNCPPCRIPEHDQCGTSPDCPCCQDARRESPDMSKWKTLPEISIRLDEVRAKLTEAEDKLDALEASGRTVVYRTDPGTPCADCGGGYREDPADPESYIPHLTTLCPAIS